MTRKNQFELVTASFNNQEEPVSASHSQFQWQGKLDRANYSQFQQAVRTTKNQFELDTASFNEKENQFWASFNNQEEPVWVIHSQFQWQKQTQFQQWQGKTGLSQEELVWASHNKFQQRVTTSLR